MDTNKIKSFFGLRLTGNQIVSLTLVGSLGISLAVFAYVSLKHLEEERIRVELRKRADVHVTNLQERIDDYLDEITSLESFYQSSEYVTRDEFTTFAKTIMKHEVGIRALEWIPYVPGPERNAYEQRARQDGLPDFVITEQREQGVMVPASERDFYLPVYYIEPLEGNEQALGFDLASNTIRLEALEMSRDTGMMIATRPIRLVQEKANKSAFLAFLPLYNKDMESGTVEERRKNLKGFVLGVSRVDEIVADAFSATPHLGLDMYVYEKTPSSTDNGLIYFHSSRSRPEDFSTKLDEKQILEKKHFFSEIAVADKKWNVYCMPLPEVVAGMKTWQVWGVPLIILLLGTLIMGYLIIILDREERAQRHAFDLNLANTALEREFIERQQAEEALRLSEERYRGFVQNFAGIAYRGNIDDFTPVFFHGAVEEITGYREEDLTNGDPRWDHVIYPADLPKILSNKKIISEPDYVFEREYRIVKKDGRVRWIKEIGRNVPDSSGVPRYVEGIIYDITERRRLEEEIQRTRKIESVGVLAGGIAHDFNNILMAIVGNISLAKTSLDPDDRSYTLLQQAEKASMRARDLTQQLLTFSKGGEPVKELAEISEVIKDSADFVVRGSRVRCEYHIQPDLWPVEIDRGQISQVIQNIVLNANHAMPDGGIITIQCSNLIWNEDQPLYSQLESPILKTGEYIRITIEDTGIGIPPDMLDRIFDPYFTTKSEGSGLGLAISHSIIKNHQGSITVISDTGGTVFTIYLPASTSREVSLTRYEDEVLPDFKARVLVMDDQEIVRETVMSLLGQLGHESVSAVDGEEAVKLYREYFGTDNHLDLLIMDLTVPGGMGGEAAVKEILKINPEARVIVTSGYSNNPVMANYAEYGFCAAIVKPYRLEDVRRAIIQAVS
jgi:PAS domain S-box-containing protein